MIDRTNDVVTPIDVDALRRRGGRGADLAGADLRGANLADLDLTGARLHRADLRGADVSGADLSGADLSGVLANGAKFHRARLHRANLDGADLSATNLTATDLAGATLVSASLVRAILAVADLRGADLTGADLSGAVLLEARLDGATLVGVRLKRANVARTILAPDGARYRRPAALEVVTPSVPATSVARGPVPLHVADSVDLDEVHAPGHPAVAARDLVLVLVDLTGYTEFVKFHEDTIEHAHEVVSDLLDHLARRAEVPLTLNKFEGDAILMYADVSGGDQAAIGTSVVNQLLDIFPAFDARLAAVRERRHVCPCLACRSVGSLAVKIVAHRGRAALRRVRHLDELGGVDVIVAHRLLKNEVTHRQYLLATEALLPAAAVSAFDGGEAHVEEYPHLGAVRATVFARPRPSDWGAPSRGA